MSTALRIVLVLGLLSGVTAMANDFTCPEESIFSQPPMDPNEAWMWDFSEDYWFRTYVDYYDVPTESIRGVTWWGFLLRDEIEFFVDCVESTPVFTLHFYEDGDGRPGAEICEVTVTANVTYTQRIYGFYELVKFSATIDGVPCGQRPVTTSGWIGIEGAGDTDCWFAVITSNGLDGTSYIDAGEGTFQSSIGDIAFCLEGAGPSGACCDMYGDCYEDTESACSEYGTWLGPDVTCDENPCEPAYADCNENEIPDDVDIAEGTSEDCDENGVPDECQADSDNDGVIDACDGCPNDPAKTAPGICGCGVADVDTDGDGWLDCEDNCIDIFNADQADEDGDGIGDACDDDAQQEQPEPNEPVDVDPAFIQMVIDTIAGHTPDDPNAMALGERINGLFEEDPNQVGQSAPGVGGVELGCGLCPVASTLLLTATLVGLAATRRRA
jgi:hypothetical protein